MIKNDVETVILGNKVVYKRYFDVSVDLLFEVWSSRKHLEEWWGPDGFTVTTNSLDFSDGGIWDFVMHGPDGRDYKNRIQFLKIERPRSIFYKHLGNGEGEKDVDFESKILFEETGEGVNLTMEQIFPNQEELERVNRKYGAIEGGKQHVGNLVKYLSSLK
ncbi:SRPBCC domain-containing protein [Leptospira ellisii]|uniref:ATPase n=1 Tax=Leptospira ellisii TaxID=2023197 RepID=A0A2N0B6L4_9LEPT|nr:SRPBCC domain-containing protein [Leptospira ellisii]MDV6234791.1 SRPBCC domain-containing protein [Leptospira ellisii]PJZ92179.1 ATPase [Leptospira ellisii]